MIHDFVSRRTIARMFLRSWAAVAVSALLGLLAPAIGLAGEHASVLAPESAPTGAVVGTGDGRIHVIPSLSAPSIKNGEKLKISAVVRSQAMVASVTADLGGLAKVALRPDTTLGGVSLAGSTGLWSAEWTGAGLEEKVYPVSITVTDIAGHSHTDTSMRFSDPAAGLSTPGTTAYLAGGMSQPGKVQTKSSPESWFRCAAVDPAAGYAYFGTNWVSPGRIVKVALGDGTTAPVRVASVDLAAGEEYPAVALMDSANGYLYIGTDSTSSAPARVIKIAVGAGDAAPVRLGAAAMQSGETNLSVGDIDPVGGYLYFANSDSPARVIKVAVGTGDNLPVRLGALTLNAGENLPRSLLVDAAAGYGYVATGTTPGSVVKIALGAGDAVPTRVGALALETGDTLYCGAIDVSAGYAYLGTNTTPGRVVKVALGEGNALPTRVGAVDFLADEGVCFWGFVDSATGHGWFGANAGTTVIKISLGAGDNPPVRLGKTTNASNTCYDAAYNPATGRIYAGSYGDPAKIFTVDTGTGDTPPAMLSTVTLPDNAEHFFRTAVIDSAAGYAYFGTYTTPGRVVKVGIGPGYSAPTRVGALLLEAGEDKLVSSVIDPAAGYAYFGTDTGPGKVVKVALGSGDAAPVRVGALTLDGNAGESALYTGLIDTAAGYAYFGTWANPARVVKIALGAGATPPTRIGSLLLNQPGEFAITSAAIDSAGGYAYFGTGTQPGRVVKVDLGVGDALPTRVGAVTLNSGENYLYAASIDPGTGYGYFGTFTSPSSYIVKVALGAGAAPPTRVAALALSSNEVLTTCGAIDPAGYLLFGGNTDAGWVIKVAPGSGDNPPARIGAMSLATGTATPGSGSGGVGSLVIDPSAGIALAGNRGAVNGYVHKMMPSHKGAMRATKFALAEDAFRVNDVRLYSHAAAGNVRLALYDNSSPKKLLWESGIVANAAANAEVIVPVSSGTPSTLSLAAGTYWLAWQTDSTALIGSYTPGAAGSGFVFRQSFGPAPATLTTAQAPATTENWTEYLTYSTDDAHEPDQGWDEADSQWSLFPGMSYDFLLKDADWHRIALEPGHVLRVVVDQFDASKDNIQIQLFDNRVGDSVGFPIQVGASYGTTGTESTFYIDRTAISLDQDNAGFLYLRVYSEGNLYPGTPYRVQLFDLGRDDAFEPNNVPCEPITIQRGTTYTDLIAGDDDVFHVDTAGLQSIHVTLTQASKYAGQLYWQVLDDNTCAYDVIHGFYTPNLATPMEADVDVSGRSAVLVRVYPGFVGGTNMYSLRVD